MFFTQKPEQYFSRCWIEVVVHKDFSGKGFTETYFKGPIHQQLRDVLRFIQTTVIHEVVEKLPDRAEANRYFNFPYIAVEEAVSNAVYHKSYEIGNPIEVQITKNAFHGGRNFKSMFVGTYYGYRGGLAKFGFANCVIVQHMSQKIEN